MAGYAAQSTIVFTPEPLGPLDIYEAITDEGMELLSRELTEGLRFRIVKFSVGTGGVDYSVTPPAATPVDTSATALENEIFRDDLDIPVERPNFSSIAAYFRILQDEATGFLGEFGLWAEVVSSTYEGEIGQLTLFAVAHTPPYPKSNRNVFAHRFIFQL